MANGRTPGGVIGSERTALAFGPFWLSPDGHLVRRGAPVALPPKAAALLHVLAGAEGRLVSKDEILDRLWPDDDVAEASLTTCVHTLRSALGDRGRRGRYLETVYGRGYRFHAAVRREATSAAPRASRVRVAVVPFDADQAEREYLAHGFVGELVSQLGRWHGHGIDAIARDSAGRWWRERGRRDSRRADALGIDFAVTGRLRRHGPVLVVALDLVRALDDVVVWSGEFRSPARSISLVAAEVAEALAKRLVELLGSAYAPQAAAPVTGDANCYNVLLRGFFLNQFRTESGLRRSIRCFEQALALDPRCASAHAALAEAHLNLGWRGFEPPLASAAVARGALARALDLDERHVGAHATLAFLRLLVDWDPRATDEALAAVEGLEPGNDRAAWLRAMVHLARGRFDASLAALEAARVLDPFSANLAMAEFMALWWGGRLEAALEVARTLASDEPDYPTAHAARACIAATLGLRAEALAAAEAGDASGQGDQITRTSCAWAFAAAGRPDAARSILAALERRAQSRYVSPSCMAVGYAGLGEVDRAVAWLGRARAVRCMWFPFAGVDPRLAPVRADGRFAPLARGLAHTGRPRARRPRPQPTAP